MGQEVKRDYVIRAFFLDLVILLIGLVVGQWFIHSDLLIEIHEQGHINSMAFNEGGTPYVERINKYTVYLRGPRTPEQLKRFTLAGYAAEHFAAVFFISLAMILNKIFFRYLKFNPMIFMAAVWFTLLYDNIQYIPYSVDFSYYPEEIDSTITFLWGIIAFFSILMTIGIVKNYKKLNRLSKESK